jgi:hypothetical protein
MGLRRCSNDSRDGASNAVSSTSNVNNNRKNQHHANKRRHPSCESCLVSSASIHHQNFFASSNEYHQTLGDECLIGKRARKTPSPSPTPSPTPGRRNSPSPFRTAADVKRAAGYRWMTVRRRWQLGLCVVFAVLSMLSKEHGLTVLGVCAFYDVFVVSKLKPRDVIDAVFTVSNTWK